MKKLGFLLLFLSVGMFCFVGCGEQKKKKPAETPTADAPGDTGDETKADTPPAGKKDEPKEKTN